MGEGEVRVTVELEGLDDLLGKLKPDALIGPALTDFFHRAGYAVEREAKMLAPVDTGRLKSSITTVLHKATIPQWAEVGTIVKYAPFVEFGHAQQPGRYVPAIGKRLVASWVAARPFLMPGFKKARPRINSLLGRLKSEIESRWGK